MELNRMIDHTSLKANVQDAGIEALCAEAKQYGFASVCVNPYHVPLAKKLLAGTTVRVCTVIGFPLGADTARIKAAQAAEAVDMGAEELDMVINVGALKDGKDDYVRSDIHGVVEAARGRIVKVIIETGLLTDEEKVRAVELACQAGASFVKTCTGFSGGAATPEDVALMRRTAPAAVKVKAAGGIRTWEDAMRMIEAGAERIGTSAGTKIMESAPKA